MSNKLAGVVEVELDGKMLPLRYDWDGISEIAQEFPEGYNLMDPSHLSKIMAIGLRDQGSSLDAEQIRKMSPPIIAAMEAVGAAINCAYFGTPVAPEASGEEQNPRMRAVKKA